MTLTNAQLEAFARRGYLVIEGLVPESLCAAARASIAAWLGYDPDDQATWYRRATPGHGSLPIHHRQSLWDVRQFAPLYDVFRAVLGTDALWVTADRVSFKPPARGFGGEVHRDPLHWDADPEERAPLTLQGLVYLDDVGPEQGPFCCVPSLLGELDGYLAANPGIGSTLMPDWDGHELETVPAPRGTLIVWDQRLPHSSMPNLAERPRWTQYVSMTPVGGEVERRERCRRFERLLPPDWALTAGLPGEVFPEPGEPAVLTELGRKLVGFDVW